MKLGLQVETKYLLILISRLLGAKYWDIGDSLKNNNVNDSAIICKMVLSSDKLILWQKGL
jgi:hypothetical protein